MPRAFALRSPGIDPREPCHHCLRAALPGSWPAPGDQVRQWRAVRQSKRPLFLSKLSVWWLRLGIAIERIKPGHPQQNGRHERMHLTLKKEATRPPGSNSLQQQDCFDGFIREFNTERPHE